MLNFLRNEHMDHAKAIIAADSTPFDTWKIHELANNGWHNARQFSCEPISKLKGSGCNCQCCSTTIVKELQVTTCQRFNAPETGFDIACSNHLQTSYNRSQATFNLFSVQCETRGRCWRHYYWKEKKNQRNIFWFVSCSGGWENDCDNIILDRAQISITTSPRRIYRGRQSLN